MVVGPDLFRVLERWKAGIDEWRQVIEVIEWGEHFQGESEQWSGARHEWNCEEGRVVGALTAAGFADVTPVAVSAEALAGYPVTSYIGWQCAVRGRGVA